MVYSVKWRGAKGKMFRKAEKELPTWERSLEEHLEPKPPIRPEKDDYLRLPADRYHFKCRAAEIYVALMGQQTADRWDVWEGYEGEWAGERRIWVADVPFREAEKVFIDVLRQKVKEGCKLTGYKLGVYGETEEEILAEHKVKDPPPANWLRWEIEGAPFRMGQQVRVVKIMDKTIVEEWVGREGTVIYYEYDCGCGQEYPHDPMIGVFFPNGDTQEFWKEELEAVSSPERQKDVETPGVSATFRESAMTYLGPLMLSTPPGKFFKVLDSLPITPGGRKMLLDMFWSVRKANVPDLSVRSPGVYPLELPAIGYHVTPRKNLKSIFERGLQLGHETGFVTQPFYGAFAEASYVFPIFVFTRLEDAQSWPRNWEGPPSEGFAILAVELHPDNEWDFEPEWNYVRGERADYGIRVASTTKPISPEHLVLMPTVIPPIETSW